MDYCELTTDDFTKLRRERVISLEAAHYRLQLLISEAVDGGEVANLLAQQADYERRLAVYHGQPIEVGEPAPVNGE